MSENEIVSAEAVEKALDAQHDGYMWRDNHEQSRRDYMRAALLASGYPQKVAELEAKVRDIEGERHADQESFMARADVLFGETCEERDRLRAENADFNIALDLLSTLFSKYENGDTVYDDPETMDGCVGKAIDLDDNTFHACADLLNKHRPVGGQK